MNTEWFPIEKYDVANRKQSLLIAVRPEVKYITDVYAGWKEPDGSFARWPHNFPPTHFAYVDKSTLKELL